ncbi:MAG: nucleotidyltransferase family protein [Terriglobia bacterium]
MKRDLARAITDYLAVSGPLGERVTKLASFDRGDWQHSLEWLDQTGLALWLLDRLKVSGAHDAVPPEIGVRLKRNMADHSSRVAAMAEEFDSINRLFEADGIEYVVLKGFALAPEYTPDARLRPAYDYDYLVRPESMGRVSHALGSVGYVHRRERVDHPVVYVHSSRAPRIPSQPDDLYSADLPRSVEIHTRLWEPEALKIPLPLPDDFLARKRPRIWHGLRFFSLSEEDELLFQVLHAFRHIIECWCRLYTFLEIAHFLERRQSDMAFWQRFADRIRVSPRLPEMVGVVFSLAARLFGAPVSAAIDAGVLSDLRHPLLLWVSRYGCDSALANFTGNKYSLLLYREFIPDDATWREIQRKRLFPLHRPNRAGGTRTPGISARLIAGWKQSAYVARRLFHHVISAAQYEWESIQWERIRIARR